MKSGGIHLNLWAQTSLLSELMRSCKCLPQIVNMPNLTYITFVHNLELYHLFILLKVMCSNILKDIFE